jgi:hypothetical protein
MRVGHDGVVRAPLAELSSIATALDELTRRVTALADAAAASAAEELARELYDLERALGAAGRRLARLADPRAPRR